MKVRIDTWRVTWRFLIVYLIIVIIAFVSFMGLFFKFDLENHTVTPAEFGTGQIIFLVALGVVFIVTYIPTITCFYYIIEDKYFIMKKYWKEYEFNYSNIEFIDIEESKRKDMVIFYSPKSKMKYLLGDRDGKLLETLIKKCPKNMSVAEFRRKHPEERY